MKKSRGIKNLFRSPLRTSRSPSAQQKNGGRQPMPELLYSDVKLNEQRLRSLYANNSDVVFRTFQIGGRMQALLVYIEGLSDTEAIDRYVMAPLMSDGTEARTFGQLIEQVLFVSQVSAVTTFNECMDYLSRGYPIVLCDGESSAYALGLSKWEQRGIEEPQAEVGIRGPREGFTETLRVNTSQLRRIIKSPPRGASRSPRPDSPLSADERKGVLICKQRQGG